MTINELLTLERNQSSIKKIDLFISSCDKFSLEYIQAICFKAIIFHKIKKTNDALKLVYSLVPNFKQLSTDSVIVICDTIIGICLEISRFDQVEKYMNIKKRYLPISMQNIYLKDQIKLYLKKQDNLSAKTVLLEYLTDDLTKEEEIFAKDNLADIYFNTKNYTDYLSIVKDLEDYYQNRLDFIKLTDIAIKKLIAYSNTNNHLKVILDGSNLLHESKLKPNDKVKVAGLLIKSYVEEVDYKKASIIESDYEEFLDEVDENIAYEFSKYALELYTKTNSLISIKTYDERVKKYAKEETKEVETKKNNEEYQIPIIKDEVIDTSENNEVEIEFIKEDEVETTKIKHNYKKIENTIVSENYKNLKRVFDVIAKESLDSKFREIYRKALIEANKLFKFKESYILYYLNEYKGHHYKVERVYDKKLEYNNIENTLNFLCMDKENEIFLDNDSTYNINIVTNTNYDNNIFGIAFPLKDDTRTIGSIAFFSDEDFLNIEMNYESLKLISAMLNISLNNCIRKDKLLYENRKLYYLASNLPFIIKEEANGFIHLSYKDNFLKLNDDIEEDVFINHIKATDAAKYKKKIKALCESTDTSSYIEYDFLVDDKYLRLKELMYPLYNDGVFSICSIIENITEYEDMNQKLKDLAYKNPTTKLDTELKLMIDLDKSLNDKKSSLVIVKINSFSYYKDIYGYNFSNQLIYAVGNYFKDHFINDFNIHIYHLNGEIFSILIDGINDKRIITSKLNEAIQFVSKKIFELNSRVKLTFSCGVFRLSKNLVINNASKVFSLAMDALNDIDYDINYNFISHYDSENHKKKFAEKQLVTHISEAIDHGKISIYYKQIVNIKTKELLGFLPTTNLDNYEVDNNYFDYVVSRRNLSIDILKYLISNTIREQKIFKDETKGKLLVFIKMNNEFDLDMYKFIKTQVNFYKYFENKIVFYFDKINDVAINLKNDGYFLASNNLIDLINDKINYLFYDIKSINNKDEIKELCSKHNTCLIIDNVDTKDDIDYISNNDFENCYGKFYKKGLKIKNIIDKVI